MSTKASDQTTEFSRKVQEEMIEIAGERLAQWEAEEAPSALEGREGLLQEEEFAERAARRLEAVARRVEQEGRRLEVVDGEKTLARAQELRVAAHMVRDEGRMVALRDRPFPQGAQERDETGLRAG